MRRFALSLLLIATAAVPAFAGEGRPFTPAGDPPAAMRELSVELMARPVGQWLSEMYRRHRRA